MRRALIEVARQRLCQVVDTADEFPVHPADLQWIDCADDVTPETHDFDGVTFNLKPGPTQEEIDRQARRAALSAEAAADAFIDALREATPDQIKTFVQNNVTDLASARLFIGKLACAVAYALNGGQGK